MGTTLHAIVEVQGGRPGLWSEAAGDIALHKDWILMSALRAAIVAERALRTDDRLDAEDWPKDISPFGSKRIRDLSLGPRYSCDVSTLRSAMALIVEGMVFEDSAEEDRQSSVWSLALLRFVETLEEKGQRVRILFWECT